MSSIYLGIVNAPTQSLAGALPESLSFAGWAQTTTPTGGILKQPQTTNPDRGAELIYTVNALGNVTSIVYNEYNPTIGQLTNVFRVLVSDALPLATFLADPTKTYALITGGSDFVWGNDFDNVIYAGAGADTIRAGAGNDQIFGGADNDFIDGGAGADLINGGSGIDRVSYQLSTVGVTVNLASGLGTGGEANGDRYVSIENIEGGQNNDTLIGDNGANQIDGGYGYDVIYGMGGNDIINGNFGGATGSALNSGGNRIHGGDGNDTIIGGTGRGLLFGDAGDDTITANGVADYVDGGTGWDLVNYVGIFTDVTVNLAAGRGTGGAADGDIYVSIEAVATHTGNDVIIGSNGDNYVWSGGGNDQIYGLAGNDKIESSFGDDILRGDEGADILNGGEGIDRADYYNSNAGVVVNLTTGVGYYGHAQGDVLISIENLFGSAFNDVMTGSALANTLFGNSGNDQLYGLAGNDRLEGQVGDDALFGGDGNDTIGGGDGNDGIFGEAGNDNLYGGNGNDYLSGGDGNDVIWGDAGNDQIDAGAGNDYIVLGLGDDSFTLGAGDDRVRFDYGNGIDTIFDFGNGHDIIDFSATDMTLAALQANAIDTNAGVLLQVGSGSILLAGLALYQLEWNYDFAFAA